MRLCLAMVLAFLAMWPLTQASARIEWESVQQTVSLKPGEQSALASYRFQNTGTGAVHIDSVQASCGCVVTNLAKKDFEAGESGSIEINFHAHEKTGRHELQIVVTSNDGTQRLDQLALVAIVPEILTLEPQIVFWRQGKRPKRKHIVVQAQADFPVIIKSVTSTNKRFVVHLQEIIKGQEYRISVEPTDTNSGDQGIFFLETDLLMPHPQRFYAFAEVVPSATPP